MYNSHYVKESSKQGSTARTDKLDRMNKTDLTDRREIKQAESQSDSAQLTGYESPQRRRFLRALAAEERCGD